MAWCVLPAVLRPSDVLHSLPALGARSRPARPPPWKCRWCSARRRCRLPRSRTALPSAAQGKDHTIFATVAGNVQFKYDKHKDRKYISVKETA